MSKKKTLLTILAVVLVCCIAVTGTLAFLTEKVNDPVVNTFTAAGGGRLIDEDDGNDDNGKEGFFLKESQVAQQENGSYDYVLVGEKKVEVDNNSYKVVPSTDLPKDPYVRIVGKTEIPAYLYVEVVDGLNGSGLSCNMASCWIKLDGVTGNNGGQIYVYNNGELVTDKTAALAQIQLLDGNKIIVGDDVSISAANGIQLKFYGYLAQATAGENATAAFNTCFKAA